MTYVVWVHESSPFKELTVDGVEYMPVPVRLASWSNGRVQWAPWPIPRDPVPTSEGEGA